MGDRNLRGASPATIPATPSRSNIEDLYVRWMLLQDGREVYRIAAASDVDHEFFEECSSLAENKPPLWMRPTNRIGMVADSIGSSCGSSIYGFMIYDLLPGAIWLRHFAVDPPYRRLGVGRVMLARLLGKLLSKLSHERRNKIMVTVRESNLPAQLFFREHGFRVRAIKREYYNDTGEDGYEMRFTLRRIMHD